MNRWLAWLCFALNILIINLAIADDVTLSQLAGRYVMSDRSWVPSSLILSPAGKFTWYMQSDGDHWVNGAWSVKEGNVLLRADEYKGKAVYKNIAPNRVPATPRQDGGHTLAVYVVGVGSEGIENSEVLFESDKGLRQTSKKTKLPGFFVAELPEDWGVWHRVGLRQGGSEQTWQWFTVSDVGRTINIMSFRLVNANLVAPVFRESKLKLVEGGNLEMLQPNMDLPISRYETLTYRRESKHLSEQQLVGRYKAVDFSYEPELVLNEDHTATWKTMNRDKYILEGVWSVDNGFLRMKNHMPSEVPVYHVMAKEELNVVKQALPDELIAVVGIPGIGGADGIETKFEVNGKVVGSAVSDRTGDAILKWKGNTAKWSRVAVRRAKSRDPWVWLEVPIERRQDRIMGIAINDRGLTKPMVPELIFGQAEDGTLIAREPLTMEVVQYEKVAN
ncbi:hypothetical protein [Vogesella sp. LIG4]|uniref:hypothetical protein n=1 Tax=Vogesella sp. LIG4 TaxID=1192162 RepID=UPI00081FC818|nr:hypothetical protein [Vogesella sp. LIG4]SCK08562.1 hypothetical protein PSELUDRAFT_0522 [Vogesella sp. LIG4]